ncbi:MAG: HEAT repeat domain-containing protein [Limisphaerales bacterium]
MKDSLGGDAPLAAAVLIKIIENPTDELAQQAAMSLGKLGGDTENTIRVLTNCLVSTDPAMRWGALVGLAEMKTNAVPAIPALMTAMRDADSNVVREAEMALREIAPTLLTNRATTNN